MNTNDWFMQPPDSSKRLRLFCFPYAGGSASTYLPWKALLPDIDICPLQLPGRSTRFTAQAHVTLNALTAELADVIHCCSDRPFAFFGHSMGAIIAFELAHVLRDRDGSQPCRLIVSAAAAPSQRVRKYWHEQDDHGLMQTLRHYKGTPSQVLDNAELMQLLLPTIRADFALLDSFRYRPEISPLDCPIDVFSGRNDIHVDQEHLPAWRSETRSQCDAVTFGGGHFFLETQRAELIENLGRVLRDRVS